MQQKLKVVKIGLRVLFWFGVILGLSPEFVLFRYRISADRTMTVYSSTIGFLLWAAACWWLLWYVEKHSREDDIRKETTRRSSSN